MIYRLITARRRTLFLQFAPALFLAVIFNALPAAAASITNGDFEAVQIGAPFVSTNPADVPGWTHTGDDGGGFLWAIGFSDTGGSITVAGSGNQFVTMGGGFDHVGTSTWSTAITDLLPGDTYLLDFKMANENNFSTTPQAITVSFPAGSSTLPITFSDDVFPATGQNYWTQWIDEEMAFVATGISATVQFSATTQYDVGLDDVRVSDAIVPEPSFLGLLACGLFAGLIARKRC